MPLLLPLATVRTSIADFVDSLVWVYTILIIAYILSQLFFGLARGSMAYSSVTRPVLDFLEQTVKPYLDLFRRFIPQFGGFDLSPVVAIIVLRVVGSVVVAVIRG